MEYTIIRGAPLGPRVKAAAPLEGHRLLLTFNNWEKRVFDATPILDLKPFAPLKNKLFFELVKVECGYVAWPGEIDYCPDTLYQESVPA